MDSRHLYADEFIKQVIILHTSTTVPLVVTWAMTEEEVLTMKSGTMKQPECSVDLSGKFSMLSGLCATIKYVTKTCGHSAYGWSLLGLEILANDIDTTGPNFRLSYLHCHVIQLSMVYIVASHMYIPIQHFKITVEKFYTSNSISSYYQAI